WWRSSTAAEYRSAGTWIEGVLHAVVHCCTHSRDSQQEIPMALPKTPPTETSNVSETRRQFSETLDRVRRHEARVVVEKSGIPVGAIVSMDDLKVVEEADQDRNRLIEIM